MLRGYDIDGTLINNRNGTNVISIEPCVVISGKTHAEYNHVTKDLAQKYPCI